MKQADKELVGYWLRRYLTEYLPVVRNMSRNTIASYRDALRQLLEYVVDKGLSPDTLHVEEITPDLITGFLLYLEQTKNCSIQTRNLRLSAIHGFAGYISVRICVYHAYQQFWYTFKCSISRRPIMISIVYFFLIYEFSSGFIRKIYERHKSNRTLDSI